MSFQVWGYLWSDVTDETPLDPIGDTLFAEAVHSTFMYEAADSWSRKRAVKAVEIFEIEGPLVRVAG